METQSVRREHEGNELRDEEIKRFVASGLTEEDQYKYLDDFTPEQLKEIFVKTAKAKEGLLQENLAIKDKYMALLEKLQEQQ